MTNQEVKLLSLCVSRFGLRVEWALKLKGVEYEYIEEDLSNKSPLLLELNPIHKKVPLLIHGGKAILESLIILEYLDEKWKQFPLLPQDPYQRATARFWANYSDDKLMGAAWTAVGAQGDEKERAVKLSVEALEKIEAELKGKKFFGGESIGYLDLVMGWISYWLPVWEKVGSLTILDPQKFPAITSWMDNFLSHPIIKENLPPRDKMMVYFEECRKEIISA